jgi:hypothetical protein
MATFPEAPLRSRTVAFRESGSDLGSSRPAFPRGPRLKRWRVYTPDCPAGLLVAYPPSWRIGYPSALCPRTAPLSRRQVPRAPLPPAGVTLRGTMSCIVSRSIAPSSSLYGLMRQTTALPPPSALASVGGSVQVVASPCWAMVLPDVIPASPSVDAWAPVAAVRWVRLPVTSPTTSAFPLGLEVGVPQVTRSATSERKHFRNCSHSLMFRPLRLLPPRSLLPQRPYYDRRAAVAFTPEQNTRCCLRAHRACLPIG